MSESETGVLCDDLDNSVSLRLINLCSLFQTKIYVAVNQIIHPDITRIVQGQKFGAFPNDLECEWIFLKLALSFPGINLHNQWNRQDKYWS